MTEDCQAFVARVLAKYPEICGHVLEVGAFDVCGNPRHHFDDRSRFPTYLGTDMRDGPSVDFVVNCQHLSQTFLREAFNVVVDMERLEHDSAFWVSYQQIAWVIRSGGHVIITTRSWNAVEPHDHPHDYWRFMEDGLRTLLETNGFEVLELEYSDRGGKAVYALGRKK